MKKRLAAGATVCALALGASVAATGATAQRAQPAANGQITIGFITHVKGNPFIQQIVSAARDAAKDMNVKLIYLGNDQFDANTQLNLVNAAVKQGAQGIATSVPGDVMAKGLNELVAKGIPVVQFNLLSKKVKGPYVGERSTNSGFLLGKMVAQKAGKTGKAVIGTCAPGLTVLDNRGRGVTAALKANGMTGTSLQNVEVDPTANYSHWQQLSQANSDAKALIGLCAPDVESIGKVNKLGGDKFIGGGYDLTSGNIAAIRDGHAYVTLGQNPYVQGYLPVEMLVWAIKNKKALKAGFVESGSEIVTKDKVIEPYGLPSVSFDKLVSITKSAASMRSYYRPLLVSGKLKNWQAHVEPIANEAKIVAK